MKSTLLKSLYNWNRSHIEGHLKFFLTRVAQSGVSLNVKLSNTAIVVILEINGHGLWPYQGGYLRNFWSGKFCFGCIWFEYFLISVLIIYCEFTFRRFLDIILYIIYRWTSDQLVVWELKPENFVLLSIQPIKYEMKINFYSFNLIY